ncbi:sugar ABC transporter substrate-binding protein [Streptantibioticus ferralitis]|uniref:Substrate-binding domain-containing protein n=1 Tax=Streptantibioticus ferralitis TaxID=236510 RepID=A0ABT5YX88_9ACTN|nr:substrate-binding domain-containing protein [Streptantibioticus ferralitis]MDF2255931.1 substrate-binding domain-containing protein [Streptantibioticus ferralitis]
MNTTLRRAVIATAAVSITLSMTACGKKAGDAAKPSAADVSQGFRIGLALPENQTTRYEAVDRPQIQQRLRALCPKCQIDYENATQNANTQEAQLDTLINDGDKVIILDPVDYKAIQPSVEKAHAKGIKIISYDRLSQGPIDGYVSFDNTQVGKQQAQGLLDALGSKATPSTPIVMINGDSADPNAAQYKAGAHSVLNGKVRIAAEYDTTGWQATEANKEVVSAITRLGKANIAAVYSANDGMAAGVVSALLTSHVSPLPPISGQDAQLDAAQRIVAGLQSFTIYKPYAVEANTAAQMAIELATNQPVVVADSRVSSATNKNIPAKLVATTIMDSRNIRQTVIADGLYTVDQICTEQYATDCVKIGLK